MSEIKQWSPRADDNPYHVRSMLTNEEWLEISRWYPFSVRVLVVLKSGERTSAQWHEEARTSTWDKAKEIMQALVTASRGKDHLQGYVVMQCDRRGKEGREKPVLWSPSESSVLAALRKQGAIKQ
jgi:hypothetical protein